MARTEPATTTRVASIDATLVRVPPVRGGSAGEARQAPRSTPHAVVRVTDTSGTSGWGEVPAATPERWRLLVESFAPALLRHSWHRPTDAALAFGALAGCPPVQAGLDAACWDLWSRQRDTPLSHALGGTRTAITAGVTVGRQPTPQSLAREVNRHVGSGFRRVRLEIQPGWDLDAVRAVQDSFPFLVLQVDCGGRYTEDPAHLETLHALDGHGLLAIEQPFAAHDLAAHARLRHDLRTPIALDASVDSLDSLDEAIRLEAGSALNLRTARMGGLTAARRAHDRAADAGWQVWCGSDSESGVGRSAIVALASLPGVTLPSDMPGAGARFAQDLTRPAVRAHDGVVPVPLTQPGLGHDIDTDALRRLTVRSTTVRG